MSAGGFGVRVVLTGVLVVTMVGFGLLLRGYTTESRDPYLSVRAWWAVIGVGAVGVLVTTFTTPFSRSAFAVRLPAYVVFILGFVRVVRGLGRVGLLLPALIGSSVTGTAHPVGDTATAPFSGRPCLYCAWRVERDASGELRDRELYETTDTGVVGGPFRVEDHDDTPVDVRDATVLAAREETISRTDWVDDPRPRPGVDDELSNDTATRAIERYIEAGDTVTVLPGVVYCGELSSVRRTVVRSLFTRIVVPGLIAGVAAATLVTTACLPS